MKWAKPITGRDLPLHRRDFCRTLRGEQDQQKPVRHKMEACFGFPFECREQFRQLQVRQVTRALPARCDLHSLHGIELDAVLLWQREVEHLRQQSRHSRQLDPLPLQLAHLLEAAVPRVAEHDVIHEIDAHHHAGRRQPPCQVMIVGAGGRIPRWMVVENQDRRRNRSFS